MRSARTPLVLLVFAGLLALAAGSAIGAAKRKPSKPTKPPALHVTVGIGDEQPTMFSSPEFKALHTTIARYVTPYDVATNHSHNDLPRLKAWLAAAARASTSSR